MKIHGCELERNSGITWFAERCSRGWSAARSLMASSLGRSQTRADNALRVEERLSLGTKKMLYLVSCREKEFLIAAGADAIVSVVEVSQAKPVQVASPERVAVSRMQKRERLP